MIAVVVPTIRLESYSNFLKAWEKQFFDHNVTLVTVFDGESPKLECDRKTYEVKDIMEEYEDLIYNYNDGVRNLGFAYIAKELPWINYIISFDDDVVPNEDTIGDHISALESRVPTSWISTASEYMRGFPYDVRNESEVVLSHGVWENVADFDAPTQLVKGIHPVKFYEGPIPKGVFYPMCAMNFAFKRCLLPYIYQAPMGPKVGIDRFADIWAGIESKKVIDDKGWAVVSGKAKITHLRASNVFKNIQKEAKGLELNETFWKDRGNLDPYFAVYESKRNKWKEFINKYL